MTVSSADSAKQAAEQRDTLHWIRASVQQSKLRFGTLPLSHKLVIRGVVKFAPKHFLLFAQPLNCHHS